MPNELQPIAQPTAVGHVTEEYRRAEELAEKFRANLIAPNTAKAYRADWNHFDEWCKQNGVPSLPARPKDIAVYLAHLAEKGRKVSTIQRRLAAIRMAHKAAGYESPTNTTEVETQMRAIRRTLGVAQRGKAPLLTADIEKMVAALDPNTVIGCRNRALLLVGFAGAFRRSELVGVDVEHNRFVQDHGLIIHVPKSKADQEGEGLVKAFPYAPDPDLCPTRAMRAWLEMSGITSGPVFRPVNRHGRIANRRLSDRAVAETVKRLAKAVGLNPEDYAGHSLRAGFITQADLKDVKESDIMRQTGHKSSATVRRYIRHNNPFKNNPASRIW